jgi:hypothetical protein
MGTDAGIQRFAIIAVPTIATGESGTMSANNDDADNKLNFYHQNRAFLGLYE